MVDWLEWTFDEFFVTTFNFGVFDEANGLVTAEDVFELDEADVNFDESVFAMAASNIETWFLNDTGEGFSFNAASHSLLSASRTRFRGWMENVDASQNLSSTPVLDDELCLSKRSVRLRSELKC